jgi:glycosyltransferase involved in cell wall biosynthesis
MGYRIAVLHQGFVPTYRKAFFELLNRTSTSEYVVFHGDPPGDSGLVAAAEPYDFPNVRVVNREIPIGRWRAIWQPVVRQIARGDYDAVVLGHEVKFLSNLTLAALFRMRRRSVLLWGFGFHVKMGIGYRNKASATLARATGLVKDAIARRVDGYLAYTDRGAEALRLAGVPDDRIWVIRNTIDIAEQCELHDRLADADEAALRRELGLKPDSVVFLFLGRLVEAKRAEEAIEAVIRLNEEARTRHPVELVVIGGGPKQAELASRYAGRPGILLRGRIPEEETVARYMRVASALLLPGYVGLAVNHAFAHGLPVITRRHELHSPEVEYIEDGRSGLIIDGDFRAFVSELAGLADDPGRLQRLAAGALEAREGLRLESMVTRFDEAVTATIGRQRSGPAWRRESETDRRAAGA